MPKYALIAGFLLCLSGCYTVNNGRFSSDMRALVRPGMQMNAAIERLKLEGFDCDSRSAAPAITCTKTRQSLLPYTCIERVNLVPAAGLGTVERVDIPKIACAGL
jgi:hypothetical protein